MPLQHSPNKSNASANKQVQSEPDIPSKVSQEYDSSFVSVRSKRLRTDSHSETDRLSELKDEIKNMLCSWKTEQNSALASWKNAQDSILKKLVSDLAEVKSQCNTIQKSNQDIERSLEFINKQYEELRLKMITLEKENKANRSSILLLESKIQEMHRMTRSSTVEIRSVPEKNNESKEDLTTTVSDIAKTVNTKLQLVGLHDAYRSTGKPGSMRNIIVDFTRVQDKYDLLASVRNFNKSRKPADK
ncbi:unnamed protein product [Leptidea sinapis]|uniref:Uncharacterized protein n=1 Tax=Leptidea sinapis TaxID=189913 RepID=A0A5E4PKG1_9NEOP|nr:unnamed protein product [Leptidea sinapis]